MIPRLFTGKYYISINGWSRYDLDGLSFAIYWFSGWGLVIRHRELSRVYFRKIAQLLLKIKLWYRKL